MSRTKFLEEVARYYAVSHPDRMDNLVFVMPNKRSAMFLKQYVRDNLSGITLMPRFTTMGRFISTFADNPEAPRNDLLFILYKSYRKVMAQKGRLERVRDFDAFIFWGDMILSDFNDIDRSHADASALFKNLRDVREIQSDYLDPEQKDIISRIWGESRLTVASGPDEDGNDPVERFWLHLAHDGKDGRPLASKFTYLWEILGDLYVEFSAELKRRGISTQGMQYRSAARRLRLVTPDELPFGATYAFVGFNDLSTSEAMILNRLRDIGSAEFFWDGDTATIRTLAKSFPMPGDFEPAKVESSPEVEVIAMPSNVGQSKALHAILEDIVARGLTNPENPIDTAIVLPDEGLLMPVLFSIPASIKAVNITMGLPYRTTTFASLLRSIITMQLRARKIRGGIHFYYEDVTAVLNHPHIQLICGAEGDKIKNDITENNLYNISAEKTVADYPALAAIFAPVKNSHDAEETGRYMLTLLDWLENGLADAADNYGGLIEVKMLDHFRREVEDILRLVREHDVQMSENTFFSLFERMFDTTQITVSGEPLKGLQVMGVLETRALDFDNVIFLSMNEKIFPRKQYVKTMIPNALRYGYGLPQLDSQEETYAYCFNRLLARARLVKAVYDSRSGNFGSGELSRYISQLRYLRPDLDVTFTTIDLPAAASAPEPVVVRKTEAVLRELDGFKPGGKLRLSASALKSYKRCPLQFYLQYVRNMRGNDELSDFVSASQYGSVVHKVIEELYTPYRNQEITRELIDSWLSPSNSLIDDLTVKCVYKECYKGFNADAPVSEMPAEGSVIASVAAYTVRTMLEYEREQLCSPSFTFIRSEMPVDKPWPVTDELTVNFKMSIDRVDRTSEGVLRFIDFKTGSDMIIAKRGIDELFVRGEHAYDAIFQVLVYCEAYAAITGKRNNIEPLIYPLKLMTANGGIKPVEIEGLAVTSYLQVSKEFLPRLQALISEIFNPEVDFTQAEDNKSCKFCPFLSLCGRTEPRF